MQSNLETIYLQFRKTCLALESYGNLYERLSCLQTFNGGHHTIFPMKDCGASMHTYCLQRGKGKHSEDIFKLPIMVTGKKTNILHPPSPQTNQVETWSEEVFLSQV